MTDKDIIQLKENLEDSKIRLSKLEGRKEMLMKRLATEYNIVNLEEISKRLKRIKKDLAKLEMKKEKLINELTENHELDV